MQLINTLVDQFKLSQEYQDDNPTQKFTWCFSFVVTDDDVNANPQAYQEFEEQYHKVADLRAHA